MTSLRSILLPAALAVASLTAMASPALAGTAAPAAHQRALTPDVGQAPRAAAAAPSAVDETIDNVQLHCTEPGEQFTVTQTGINIRKTPGGKIADAISKGAFYDSSWIINGAGPYTCVTSQAFTNSGVTQHWVYGFSNAHTAHVGFVGENYLSPRTVLDASDAQVLG